MSTLKRKTAIALVWDFGGLLVLKGSGFIISIFLARILSPAEFGLVGMSMVFIAISQVFIDVGFTSALIQNKENSNLAYNSVFYFNIFAGIVLTGVFYIIAPIIGDFYGNEIVTNIIRLMSIGFILNSINQVQGAILKKELNFRVLTLRSVIAAIVGGIVGIIAAYSGFGVYALVLQSLTTAFLSTILLWSISTWRPSLSFSFKALKGLLGFSSFVFFDRIFSTIFNKLDVILIGKVFSPATLGFYSRAASLKDQVTIYSSSSLTKVFFPTLSSLQHDDKAHSKVYFKVLSVVSFLAFGLTGLLYALGEEIIIGLFGIKWQASVPIFQVLILGVCMYPINSMMVNAFMSKGKSKENFNIGLLRKTVGVAPLLFAYYYGIYEFTIASVIVTYLLTIMNMFFLKNYLNLSIKNHLQKIFEGMIPLIMLVFGYQFVGGFLEKIILTSSFCLCYLFFHWILQTEGSIFIYVNLKKQFIKWNILKK